ncbi:extracellular solute-binding protein [Paenibacillus sp. LMG 31456]|uniref:Extracellular solute-binding protein n=1 Tax=Paenibacillus foliorum TaxID=2654974 RepID=A0A972K2X4_9BACL|nr:ABC transporter substrate-binding protein [Paenibacillus foliorum]NOU94327.1 extracellular solute-binding protein [Paenibacillus foliorum]
MRKLSFILIVLCMTMLWIAGCGGNTKTDNAAGEAGSGGTKSENAAATKTKIEYWYAQAAHLSKATEDMISKFNASQSAIEVTGVNLGDGSALATKLQAAILAGNQPAIAMLATTQTSEFGLSRALDDLKNYFSKEEIAAFHPGMLNNALIKDQLLGIPFYRSTFVMYYNKNMLRDAGLPDVGPKNWEELKSFALKTTDKNKSVVGFEMPIDVIFFEDGVFQQKGEMFSADEKKVAFDNEAGYATVKLYQDMMKEGSMKIPSGQDSNAHLSAINDFVSQKAAIILTTSATLPTMLEGTKDKFELGVGFLPAGKQYAASTTGSNLTVLAKSSVQEKKAAVAFIKWLAQKENVAQLSELTGYIPVTKEAKESDRMKQLWDKIPQYRVAYDQLDFARARPTMRGYKEISIKIQDEIKKALLDPSIAPEDAVKSAAKQVQQLLDGQK